MRIMNIILNPSQSVEVLLASSFIPPALSGDRAVLVLRATSPYQKPPSRIARCQRASPHQRPCCPGIASYQFVPLKITLSPDNQLINQKFNSILTFPPKFFSTKTTFPPKKNDKKQPSFGPHGGSHTPPRDNVVVVQARLAKSPFGYISFMTIHGNLRLFML